MFPFSYIGSKKSEAAPESRPAAAAWSGSFLSGSKRRAAGRPEPLWRPACEEEEKVRSPSPEVSKPSVSKLSQGDTPPPSPRTLKAIQAAMNDSSDEEKVDRAKNGGSLSPRTLLAIQQALAEEEEGAAESGSLISSSPAKLQVNIPHPAPRVVISSSEEEREPDDVKSLPLYLKSALKGNPTSQSSHVKDSLLVSSSEDEMEEVTNKALSFALLKQPRERGTESETKKGQLIEDMRTGSRGQTGKQEELERRAGLITENGDLVQPQRATASSQNNLPISLSAQISGKPPGAETENDPVVLEPRRNKEESIEVKSEASEESESEGAVIFGSDHTLS